MVTKVFFRSLIRTIILTTGFVFSASFNSDHATYDQIKYSIKKDLLSADEMAASKTLVAAVVQMRSTPDLDDNVERIKNFIYEAAGKGARIVVFPECALTSYIQDVLISIDIEKVRQAEKQVADACREAGVYAILGTPYRAQIKARAVENSVYVVHSNAPANQDASGSHGHSRIIAPTGNIIQEASIFGEDILIAELDISKASRSNALKSLNRGPLKDWWEEGIKRVKLIGFE